MAGSSYYFLPPLPSPHLLQPTTGGKKKTPAVCVREWKRLFVCSGEHMAERRIKWEMCYIGFTVTACGWTTLTLAAAGPLLMGGRRQILDFTWLTHYVTVCLLDWLFGPITHCWAGATHVSTHIQYKHSGSMCVWHSGIYSITLTEFP